MQPLKKELDKGRSILDTLRRMKIISTRQAAKVLGLHPATLANYIAVGKLPSPNMLEISGVTVHAWTEQDIETARKLLPRIANGRKTRYQRQREKERTRPRAATLPRKRGTKKKK